jgi:hypothetical protein
MTSKIEARLPYGVSARYLGALSILGISIAATIYIRRLA